MFRVFRGEEEEEEGEGEKEEVGEEEKKSVCGRYILKYLRWFFIEKVFRFLFNIGY